MISDQMKTESGEPRSILFTCSECSRFGVTVGVYVYMCVLLTAEWLNAS